MATYGGAGGQVPAALDYARELIAVAPDDAAAKQLLAQRTAEAG
ncbi:MAG: hypothetical protein ACM3NQ_24900 [Bacteroidales bacterium]